MKIVPYILLVASACFYGCHVTPTVAPVDRPAPKIQSDDTGFSAARFPLLDVPEDFDAISLFVSDPAAVAPWTKSQRLPISSIKDIGLSGKVRLAKFGPKATEAGYPVLMADDRGHMFGFCATNVTDYNGFGDSFILGTLSPSRRFLRVLPGTPTYEYLFSLVWSFSQDQRYQCSPAYLEKIRSRLRLSPEDFRRFLSKPDRHGTHG